MDIDSANIDGDSAAKSERPSRRAAAVAAAAVTASDPALAMDDSEDDEEDDGDYQSASDDEEGSNASSSDDEEAEDGDGEEGDENEADETDHPDKAASGSIEAYDGDDVDRSSSKKRKSDDSEETHRKKKRRDKKRDKKEKKNQKHKKDKKEKENSSKKLKSQGKHLIEDEAELSGSEVDSNGSESGSEAADEAVDAYVPDGFVVMDEEASSGDESEVEKRPKKKVFSRLRRNKGEMQILEDDLALIEENAGRIKTTASAPIGKKALSGEIAPERVYQEGNIEEEASDAEAGGDAKAARGDEDDDEDDLDSFLVDDLAEEGEGEELNEEEAAAARKRRQEQRRRPAVERRYVDGPTREEMEEAIDIFGEGAAEYIYGGGEESDEEAVEAKADEISDDDLFGDARSRKKRTKKSVVDGLDMRSMFERKKLVEKFCTEADDVIRNTDLPERFQDVLMNRPVPDSSERQEEAKWMAVILADKIIKEHGRESRLPQKYGPRSALETALQGPIETVLTLFLVEKYEAPFIWTYRKDYLHDLMTKKHIWWILHQDSKWEEIVHRRKHLLSEIQLVVSVATEQLQDGSYSENSVEALSGRLIAVEKEAERLNDLRAEVQEAYDAALDATDQGEDVSSKDRAKVTAAAAALEEVTRDLERNAEELDRVRSELSEARRRYRLRSSVPRAMAMEFLKLFPVDKYDSIVKGLSDDLEIRDVQNFCSMLLNSSGGKNKRRLRGRNAGSASYFRARQSGIRDYVNGFSHSAAELGRSLKFGRDRVNPPTPDVDIQTFAASFVCEQFPTSADVHSAGTELLLHEIANEPSVKQYLRKFYRSKATITTRPTKKGLGIIHPFHELFGLHYLDEKPVMDFFDANYVDNSFVGGSDRTAFARLIKAEREGLITIKLEGPSRLESYVLDCFSSDIRNRSGTQRAWDDARESIVESAYKTLLLPFFEHETRRELLRLAKDAIIEEATDAYAKLVSVGPFRPQKVRFQDAVESTPFKACFFSVACIYLPADTGRDSTVFMCFVDRDGLVRAQDSIPYEARNQKRTKIRDFLKMTKPEVIVINAGAGALSLSTQSLVEVFLVKEVNEMLEAEAAARRRSRRHSEYYVEDEDDEEAKKFEPEVVLVKDDVAQIFGVSSRAKALFPGSPPGAAAAVCLARFAQEPVAEYANMWRSANEINIFGYETLFLDLHPLQSLLSEVKAPFLSSLECVIVDAVCEAGVDLNASVQHDHLAGMLAFVGGLGLRKAEALRFNIQRQLGAITSRRQIIERKLLGKVVYKNAAGFLRICDTGTHDALLDPLDDTRIHPECYVMSDFATKMCASALEVDHNAEDYIENVTRQMQQCKRVFEQQLAAERAKHDKDNPFETAAERERYYSNWMVSTERIVQRAAAPNANCATAGADMFRLLDSLEELNLEDYAEELISQGAGKRYKQLCQIKAELRYPWLDRRIPLPLLTDSDKFSLATGETDNTLYVGMRVTCKISVVKEFSALLIINDGLKGWVSKANVSDSHFENTSDVLTEGSYVEGVIINVVKDQRRAEVSLKRSMIEYGEHKWYQERTEPGSFCFEWWRNSGRPVHLDPSFDVKEALRVYRDHEEQREAALKEAKLASAKGAADRNSGSVGLNSSGAIARQIYHPFFRNCGFAEAEGELRGRGPGEVIFRPSSKSNDTLSITWAFQEGWFKHIDVQEFDKKGGSQSIGSRLLIKGEKEEFSDLDEIMSRYITPMNDLVAKMIAHRSFKLGSVEDCNEFMRISYQSGQSSGHRQIPYLVRFDPNHPGYFVLTWFVAESVNNPIKMEYIGVTPEGYKLRDKVFKTPSELINFFKANASRSAGGGSNLGQASGASNRSRLPPPPGSMPAQQAPPPVKRSRWN